MNVWYITQHLIKKYTCIFIMCFKTQFYREGSFSFINDRFDRTSITYDYKHVFHLLTDHSFHEECQFRDGERNSLNSDRPNVWDTPPGDDWRFISHHMFAAHDEKSYNRNMKWLFIIRDQGWDFFVDYYRNDKV